MSSGGHNALEAAAWGVPVVVGPDMINFCEISELLRAAGAMVMLEQARGVAPRLVELLGDPARRRTYGCRGPAGVAGNRGASKRLMALVAEQLAGH